MLLALSLRRIGARARHVAQATLGLEESVRSVRLALSLMQRARAASGAKLALRAVMVRVPRVVMEWRSTTWATRLRVYCAALGRLAWAVHVKTVIQALLRARTSRRVICARWVVSALQASRVMRVPTLWTLLEKRTVASHLTW